MKNITLIATAAMGLESVVAQEVKELGYEVTVENGKVIFDAPFQPFHAAIYGYVQQIE